jgi:hypothetical protein
MLRMGLKLTTPVFEEAKTIHALERADSVMAWIELPEII